MTSFYSFGSRTTCFFASTLCNHSISPAFASNTGPLPCKNKVVEFARIEGGEEIPLVTRSVTCCMDYKTYAKNATKTCMNPNVSFTPRYATRTMEKMKHEFAHDSIWTVCTKYRQDSQIQGCFFVSPPITTGRSGLSGESSDRLDKSKCTVTSQAQSMFARWCRT